MKKKVSFTQREPIGSSTYPMPNKEPNFDFINAKLKDSCLEKNRVSTLYVHIPFCDQLCSFCGFNKFLSPEEQKEQYVVNLIEEMRMYANTTYVQTLDIQAIYLGGGTPNSLSCNQLERILNFLTSNFPLSNGCEITCEGTPTNLDRIFVLKYYGCNRISVGIQTFNKEIRQEHLRMGQGKEELLQSIETIQGNFDTFNLDLIYNLPNQTDEIWHDDIETVLKTKATHLTLYPLVLLEKTPFYSDFVKKEKYPAPNQAREIDLFNWSIDRLDKTEFKHRYSVRDWAKKGNHCRYVHLNAEDNQVLAFGAGAHGYLAGTTYRTHRMLKNYSSEIVDKKRFPLEGQRICTDNELMQRYVVMGLRLLKRDMRPFEQKFGINWKEVFAEKAEVMQNSGYITINGDMIEFTREGNIWANNVRTYFEEEKGLSVGYTDTVSIGSSGRDHYSSISRIKVAADAETHT